MARAIAALEGGPDVLGAKTRDDIQRGIRTLHLARRGSRRWRKIPRMPNALHSQPSSLDDAFIQGLRGIFEKQIVFNTLIGLTVTSIRPEGVEGEIRMRPELIGHFSHQRLHGGVVSAGLDAMGGLAVMASLGARHPSESAEECLQRFNKLGTIDLRVDYLRPSKGERFVLRAETLRLGSRVATTRMSFQGDDDRLLAVGTGTYIVS